MHPDSQDPDLIHQISAREVNSLSQKTRATLAIGGGQGRYEHIMESSYSQDIAPSPSSDDMEDSVPALILPGSPSPTSRRANASFGDSAPGTPTTRLTTEEAEVNSDLNSPTYHRIHSTPYPKPRLPLQLTPHPQARVVSLPEWSQNRNPFLEAMRNLRSVSSPARLKRAPLPPMYAEPEDEASFDISGSSSGSSVPAPNFPVLRIPPGQRNETSLQSEHQPTSRSIPREQLYMVPEGFFFTPPSFKSLVLSPPTTGPERSLPRDRPLAPICEDLLHEAISEDEVSCMLQQTAADASSRHSRSSVTVSVTSRSSSPESVVFLSSITRVPRTFLGSARRAQPALSFKPATNEPTNHDFIVDLPGDTSAEGDTASQTEQREDPDQAQDRVEVGEVSEEIGSVAPPNAISGAHRDSDWIFFDPPKPIPALHGPSSLPYARCPSGAEGIVLDDQQALDGVVWGLPESDAQSLSMTPHLEFPNQARPADSHNSARQAKSRARVTQSNSHGLGGSAVNNTGFLLSKARTSSKPDPPTNAATWEESPSSSKEKHVRFVDTTNGNPPAKNPPRSQHTQPINSGLPVTPGIPGSDHGTSSADLTRILFDQIEKARASELRTLQRTTTVTSHQQTLDQLRRFGVPFKARPHGLPTPPSTVSPKFTPQFHPLADSIHALAPPVHVVAQRSQQARCSGGYGEDLSSIVPRATADVPVLAQSQSLEFPNSTANSTAGSLSNVKSIPLLRLRQRQHAEMTSQRKHDGPSGETLPPPPRNVQTQPVQELQAMAKQRSPIVDTSSKLSSQTQTQDVPITTAPLASALSNKTAASSSSNPSPLNRRRNRKGGKRTHQGTPPSQSGSPLKENDRTVESSGTSARKPTSQPGGRKKGTQRGRSDSLPQSGSRA